MREVAHELGQMQDGVEFERDGDQGLGAAAVLLGLVQVAGKFEGDGNLRGQSAGAADVFVVDRPGLDAVEHAEHSEHIAVRTEQGHGEELADLESGDEIQIRAGSLGGVLGDEHILLFQRLRWRRRRRAGYRRDGRRRSPLPSERGRWLLRGVR